MLPQLMAQLAFIMKWDPSLHGMSEDENHLIDYFKTKYSIKLFGEMEKTVLIQI